MIRWSILILLCLFALLSSWLWLNYSIKSADETVSSLLQSRIQVALYWVITRCYYRALRHKWLGVLRWLCCGSTDLIMIHDLLKIIHKVLALSQIILISIHWMSGCGINVLVGCKIRECWIGVTLKIRRWIKTRKICWSTLSCILEHLLFRDLTVCAHWVLKSLKFLECAHLVLIFHVMGRWTLLSHLIECVRWKEWFGRIILSECGELTLR